MSARPGSRHPRASKRPATAKVGGKEPLSHKPLPTSFRRVGFDFRQIFREGDLAVFEQINHTVPTIRRFEVVRVRNRPGFHIGDRYTGPAEFYPKAEAWGECGWTVHDQEAAFAKLREITEASL